MPARSGITCSNSAATAIRRPDCSSRHLMSLGLRTPMTFDSGVHLYDAANPRINLTRFARRLIRGNVNQRGWIRVKTPRVPMPMVGGLAEFSDLFLNIEAVRGRER